VSPIVIAAPMVTLEVTPALTSTAVAPSAAGVMVIDPVPSRVKSLSELTVTAAPFTTAIEPPAAIRMSSGPDPVAFAVVIGVVRAVEMTTSAKAPDAIIRGAIATAVASRIRIRKKPLWTRRAESSAFPNRDHADLPQVSRI
jgi:hypothetical protein